MTVSMYYSVALDHDFDNGAVIVNRNIYTVYSLDIIRIMIIDANKKTLGRSPAPPGFAAGTGLLITIYNLLCKMHFLQYIIMFVMSVNG